jgi:hypothetical protein
MFSVTFIAQNKSYKLISRKGNVKNIKYILWIVTCMKLLELILPYFEISSTNRKCNNMLRLIRIQQRGCKNITCYWIKNTVQIIDKILSFSTVFVHDQYIKYEVCFGIIVTKWNNNMFLLIVPAILVFVATLWSHGHVSLYLTTTSCTRK